MTNPQSETKIELVTEAIEALVLASVIAATSADSDRALNHQNVVDARETLKGSLREFLQPSLRLVETRDERSVGEMTRTITKTEITGAREIVDYGTACPGH